MSSGGSSGLNRGVDVNYPGESEEYREARNRLLDREIELRRLTEAVAAERRALPQGGEVPEDCVFSGEGPADGPCASCVALLDQLDGAVEHVSQNMSFAVVAKAPLDRLLDWRDERDWSRLRLLSSAGNSYNRDYLAESPSSHRAIPARSRGTSERSSRSGTSST